MRASATFVVRPDPQAVVAYLSEPRHLLVGNHRGPIVDRSDPPVEAGSWAILAFDQVRIRIEYTVVGPARVTTTLTYSGRLSRGLTGTFDYHLEQDPLTGGTTVRYGAESSPRDPLSVLVGRLSWPFLWRRIRRRMNEAA